MTTVGNVEVAGDDVQNAIGNTVSGDLVMNQIRYVRGRPSMILSEEEIAERVAEYVPVRNHDEVVKGLRGRGAVALAGPPGSGVSTTALGALRELNPAMAVRMLSTGEDDVAESTSAGPCGYLVRGRDEDPSRLRSCWAKVRSSNGFMVVIGTESELAPFADSLPLVRIRPPAAEEVYRRRLECRGLGGTHWPDWPQAAELLKDASPADGARLADIVRAVEASGGDEREVERTYRGWSEHLEEWFAQHPELQDQALMIAAAVVTPTDEASVYGAAFLLARELEVPMAGGGLTWRPSSALVDLLELSGDADRLFFQRRGYADAVLRRIWKDYPLARLNVLAWLGGLPTDSRIVLEDVLRLKVAERFADLAAEDGSAGKLLQTVARWAGPPHGEADLAYTALARTCLHPVVGGRVRAELYEWSREEHLPQTLKLVIVQVCQVLGQTYPEIALMRLRNLGSLGADQVRDEVVEAARGLAGVYYHEVLQAAARWCADAVRRPGGRDDTRLADVATRVLVALAAPELLRLAGSRDTAAPSFDDALGVLSTVLAALGRLGTSGDDELRSLTHHMMVELAVHHRAAVINEVLLWSRNADGLSYEEAKQRSLFATAVFLTLARERDREGRAAVLTTPGAIRPEQSEPAWCVALNVEVTSSDGFEDFKKTVEVWLDTAVVRADLRPGIVSVLATAVGNDPMRSRYLVTIVRGWALGDGTERRPVKEDVLTRVLLPRPARWALAAWVKTRRAITGT
ncbi:hypothetical protein [Actinomadura verrucosospora]|uniref:Uncharacterized protein n=1 Tax=Actinomadura verrucosospora TaxID=46165 RepID=A0A7D3VQ10_ACTVE|nr:hypothetical protein [Actinomadura verrucosospora]QKG20035.1 hypothetical protein ACTIVE_1671 [Actinomadura verrucosospora]